MSALPSALELEAAPATGLREPWLRRLAALLAIVAIAGDLAIVYLGSIGDRRVTLHLSPITIRFLRNLLTFPLPCGLVNPRQAANPGAWAHVGPPLVRG